jgi:hypothetical protein
LWLILSSVVCCFFNERRRRDIENFFLLYTRCQVSSIKFELEETSDMKNWMLKWLKSIVKTLCQFNVAWSAWFSYLKKREVLKSEEKSMRHVKSEIWLDSLHTSMVNDAIITESHRLISFWKKNKISRFSGY